LPGGAPFPKAALALHFAHYNFAGFTDRYGLCQRWQQGITDHVWDLTELNCSMTEKGYEHQYSEALAELRSRGSKVASPYKTTPGGIREVRIDNFRCTDRLVFERAWGHQIAEKIMGEKPCPR
jgi:hypothetical protein